MMVVGVVTSRDCVHKKQEMLSVVSTTNSNLTKYYSHCISIARNSRISNPNDAVQECLQSKTITINYGF